METYYFVKTASMLDSSKLQAEIAAAGLPVLYINTSGDDVYITFNRQLDAAEVTQLEALVNNHDGRARRKRILFAIRQDLNALTNAQKTAIWNDLNGGNPPKWALDAGPNAAAIAAIEWGATVPAGVSTAEKTEARLRLAAMYCQDNPNYLVNQTFNGTVPAINVPGDEVIT